MVVYTFVEKYTVVDHVIYIADTKDGPQTTGWHEKHGSE